MFFHYHPAYCQLHLHVCVIDHECLETTYLRHCFLNNIMANLELDSEYWYRITLQFELLSGTKLYNLLKKIEI